MSSAAPGPEVMGCDIAVAGGALAAFGVYGMIAGETASALNR